MSFLENNFFLLAVTSAFSSLPNCFRKNGAGIAEPDFTHHCRSDYLP